MRILAYLYFSVSNLYKNYANKLLKDVTEKRIQLEPLTHAIVGVFFESQFRRVRNSLNSLIISLGTAT